MDRLAVIQHVLTDNSKLTTTVALAGVSTALLLYYITRPKVKYPPGPRPWPIIGNIPQVLSSGLETFLEKNRAIYGNVYTIELSGSKRVVISGYDNFHKLLVKSADHTSTRSTKSMSPVIQEAAKTTPGLFWAPYPHWKTMRSFSLATMREDGMGRAVLEPKIMREIEQFLSHFVQSSHGKPMEMSHSLSQATCNVMSQLLYGRRFEYDDETFNQMIESVDEQLKLGILISVATSIPFGSFLMRSHVKRDHYIAHNIQLPVLNSYIEENKKNLDASDPKGVIDKFILHMQSAQEDPKQGCFSDSNAAILSIQLYVAGTETTSTALRWALLYMCLYPDIQQRAQAEIDDVIGQEKEVSNKDRRDMPFVDAVLLETLRIGNIAPNGLPHTVDIDTEIDGQIIPAGTDLMFNFTSVLYDETVFENPHTFKPDRYLEGDIVLKKQRTITFGLGRRACLGESLAKMEFFMFFVTFLQRYNIRFPEGYTASTVPRQNPIVRQPQDYQIIFEPR